MENKASLATARVLEGSASEQGKGQAPVRPEGVFTSARTYHDENTEREL